MQQPIRKSIFAMKSRFSLTELDRGCVRCPVRVGPSPRKQLIRIRRTDLFVRTLLRLVFDTAAVRAGNTRPSRTDQLWDLRPLPRNAFTPSVAPASPLFAAAKASWPNSFTAFVKASACCGERLSAFDCSERKFVAASA